MKHIIACRPGCYDLPLPEALIELKKAGLDHVELTTPLDNDFVALSKITAAADMKISSLSLDAQLDNPEQLARLKSAIAGAAQLQVKIIFLAAALKQASYETGIELLAGVAERARQAGVVLSLETHPPFAHNAAMARRTVEAVHSAGLRYNFDTANIYYYNPRGIDTVEELKQSLPYIASVHLKESAKGEPLSFNFPVFGEGIVNFPEVFKILDAHGYSGPFTMELEGPLVDGLPTHERTQKVMACVNYLRQIGALD